VIGMHGSLSLSNGMPASRQPAAECGKCMPCGGYLWQMCGCVHAETVKLASNAMLHDGQLVDAHMCLSAS